MAEIAIPNINPDKQIAIEMNFLDFEKRKTTNRIAVMNTYIAVWICPEKIDWLADKTKTKNHKGRTLLYSLLIVKSINGSQSAEDITVPHSLQATKNPENGKRIDPKITASLDSFKLFKKRAMKNAPKASGNII